MTGMRTLVELRRNKAKPSAVFVDLVRTIAKFDDEDHSFAEFSGIVSINIAETESLNDIDFRPLVGLKVFVSDNTDNRERFARLLELIDEAQPARIESLT